MSQTSDPVETVILDFGMFKHHLRRHFEADKVIDPNEHALLQMFDAPFKQLSLIHRLRNTFESLLRNGVTRHTRGKAKDVGLTIVVDANGYPNNIIQFPEQNTQPQQA